MKCVCVYDGLHDGLPSPYNDVPNVFVHLLVCFRLFYWFSLVQIYVYTNPLEIANRE